MKCLIIDSSKSFRLLLGQVVQERGFEFVEALSAGDGLSLLNESRFDLVFVSMYLKDMDGLAFASELRANTETARIPLVMITTHEDQEVLNRAVSLGVTEIFSKRHFEKLPSL